jgi:hypothetical protein
LKYPVDPGVGMVETGSMCAENKVEEEDVVSLAKYQP